MTQAQPMHTIPCTPLQPAPPATIMSQQCDPFDLAVGNLDLEQLPDQQLETHAVVDADRAAQLVATRARQAEPMSKTQQLQLIRDVQQRMQRYGSGTDTDATPSDQWLQQQEDLLLPLEQFRAGITQQHQAAWELWLAQDDSPLAKQALAVISEGVKLTFVHPESPEQQRHPRHVQLITNMMGILSQQVSSYGID